MLKLKLSIFICVCEFFVFISGGANAQQISTGLYQNAQLPIRRGGTIKVIESYIAREVPPGSCLTGTYLSADTMALGVPGVRVTPTSQFWPHNSPKNSENTWNIDRDATEYILRKLNNHALAADIRVRLATYRPTSEYFFYYTGLDLIRRFAVKAC